jgi:hypothetical protein
MSLADRFQLAVQAYAASLKDCVPQTQQSVSQLSSKWGALRLMLPAEK